MSRYLTACGGNSKRAMTLYRKNLQLSQELFTVISCFEIGLRNAIDKQLLHTLGNDWLRNGAVGGGIFDNHHCRLTKENINDAVYKLSHHYTHNKLVAELGFGVTCLPQTNLPRLVKRFFKYFQQNQQAQQLFSIIKLLYLISWLK